MCVCERQKTSAIDACFVSQRAAGAGSRGPAQRGWRDGSRTRGQWAPLTRRPLTHAPLAGTCMCHMSWIATRHARGGPPVCSPACLLLELLRGFGMNYPSLPALPAPLLLVGLVFTGPPPPSRATHAAHISPQQPTLTRTDSGGAAARSASARRRSPPAGQPASLGPVCTCACGGWVVHSRHQQRNGIGVGFVGTSPN